MSDLRDMEMLVALAQHRHFARAAAEVSISQPAFSARIRRMEQDLGVQIVHRGNRFLGFTAEGEIVLGWARRLLKDADGLRQDIDDARGTLRGTVTIGVVPTALAFAAQAPVPLNARHPGLTLRILSATNDAILRGLEDHGFDAGITYTDARLPAGLTTRPLYQERYVLLCPPPLAPRRSGTATWAEAAKLPLCLLTRDMHNRQILDSIFADVGHAPRPVMETNAFTAALGQISAGLAATIVPDAMARSLTTDAVALPLIRPEVTKPIGLVSQSFDPEPPALAALAAALAAVLR